MISLDRGLRALVGLVVIGVAVATGAGA